MKIYEDYYFRFGWKVSAVWLATSFFLHVAIIITFYDFIVYPNNGFFPEVKNIFITSASYVIPCIFYISGWKLSWRLYEEYKEYDQYKWYTIFLFLSIAAILTVDKFIFNII